MPFYLIGNVRNLEEIGNPLNRGELRSQSRIGMTT
jgi:hypothetical protein